MDVERWLYSLHSAILYKRREHPRILACVGVTGLSLPWILRDSCTKKNAEKEVEKEEGESLGTERKE